MGWPSLPGEGPVRTGELQRFTTLDGSTVRELAHPRSSSVRAQSLAEAEVPAGGSTAEHFHRSSEEIYYFTHGAGVVRIGDREFEVFAGDLVVIPRVQSTGSGRGRAGR